MLSTIELRANYWALMRIVQRLTEPHGLTPTRFLLLRVVEEQGGSTSQGRLAEKLGTSPSTVATMVAALVNKGFLAREQVPGDRRKIVLTLTPRASAALRALHSMQPGSEEEADKVERAAKLFAVATRHVGRA